MWILSQDGEVSINSNLVKNFNVEKGFDKMGCKIYMITAHYTDESEYMLGSYSDDRVAKIAMKDLSNALRDSSNNVYEVLDDYTALSLLVHQ